MPDAPAIQVQKLHPAAQLPVYAHTGPSGDLAADLHCVAACSLEPGATAAIPTGLVLGFPPGFGGLILDRSSLALKGLHTLAGVIDPGYRGELKVILTNLSGLLCTIDPGDRIAQLRIVPLLQATFSVVETLDHPLDEIARGTSGFGSTGI